MQLFYKFFLKSIKLPLANAERNLSQSQNNALAGILLVIVKNVQRLSLFTNSIKFCTLNWQEHIISDPKVLIGKPIIKRTRISVELILELFSLGWKENQISDAYPSISAESLRAVFAYLKDGIQKELYFSIPA